MSKVINFNEWRKNKEMEKINAPIPGTLTWLHCPTCKTTEYTEIQIPGGRIHKCGTMVDEVDVPIDIRAEYTISLRNMELLESESGGGTGIKAKLVQKFMKVAGAMVEQIKEVEREYQRRLETMCNDPIEAYPEEWDPKKENVEFTVADPFGIVLTTARQADKHFPKNQ